MNLHKLILSIILSSFCLLSCYCQTTDSLQQQTTDSNSLAKLKAFRQLFWDSLPKPTGWTNDYEGLFSSNEIKKLDSIISAFENETTAQICIVSLDTMCTDKEKFNDLALHIANKWGVGTKEKNNGVTICFSKGHRKIRICNGTGIEQILSDLETKELLDTYIISRFKQGNYYQGILDGLIALTETLRKRFNKK